MVQSNDGKTFVLLTSLAKQSATIRNAMLECGVGVVIPLPGVDGKALEHVVEYCRAHENDAPPAVAPTVPVAGAQKTPISTADAEFCAALDNPQRFALLLAANYLEIKPLLELMVAVIAQSALGKTPAQIYKQYGVNAEYTPEVDEETRQENPWLNVE